MPRTDYNHRNYPTGPSSYPRGIPLAGAAVSTISEEECLAAMPLTMKFPGKLTGEAEDYNISSDTSTSQLEGSGGSLKSGLEIGKHSLFEGPTEEQFYEDDLVLASRPRIKGMLKGKIVGRKKATISPVPLEELLDNENI